MLRRLFLCCCAMALAMQAALAQAPKPKFGPDAEPIFAATGYLRQAAAPDFWRLQAFYMPQFTSSACSVASAAMAVNALLGLPPDAEDRLLTQESLLESVGDQAWTAATLEGGDGVTFAQLVEVLRESLVAAGLTGAELEILKPGDTDAADAAVRELLRNNEASERDIVLAYFNQGVLTGDWDGPHVSPIGAYDAAADKVLVMDVDREWYVPYWSPLTKLIEAMRKPVGAEHGPLAGETGGLIRVVVAP